MKKAIALSLIFISLCTLFGCSSNKEDSSDDTVSEGLPYSYSCVKCIDNQTEDIKDDITVIKSTEELDRYKASISSSFDMDKGTIGENSAALNQKLSIFNENYFADKTLVISRRNFVTDDELTLLDGTIIGTKANIVSELSVGGKYEKSVRFFLIQIRNEYFTDITDISISVSDETTAAAYDDNVLMISKGENTYKTVSDGEKISEIQNAMNSFALNSSDYDFADYQTQITDITISYKGTVAIFADDFIYIDGKTYSPSSSAKQKMIDLYNALQETVQTIPTENFESDETTT